MKKFEKNFKNRKCLFNKKKLHSPLVKIRKGSYWSISSRYYLRDPNDQSEPGIQLQSELEVIRMKSEKGQSEFSSVRSQLNQQSAQIKQLESELKLSKSQLENCESEMIELQRENQELKSQASFTKACFLI